MGYERCNRDGGQVPGIRKLIGKSIREAVVEVGRSAEAGGLRRLTFEDIAPLRKKVLQRAIRLRRQWV